MTGFLLLMLGFLAALVVADVTAAVQARADRRHEFDDADNRAAALQAMGRWTL